MPKIPVVEQQLRAQERTVASSAQDMNAAVSPGRAMQQLGQGVQQFGDALHKREVRIQTTESDVEGVKARVAYDKKVRHGIRTGTLDAQALVEEYDKEAEKRAAKMTTPQSQDYFNRQNARLRAGIQKQAGIAEAKIMSDNAIKDLKFFVDENTALIENTPGDLEAVYETFIDKVANDFESGLLPDEATAHRLREAVRKEFGMAAVRGRMRTSDYTDTTHKNLKELEGEINGGKYDEYLDAAGKKKMLLETKQQRRDNNYEYERVQKLNKRATDLKREKLLSENWGLAAQGKRSIPEIAKLDLPGRDKQFLSSVARAYASQPFKSNPVKLEAMRERMLKGEVTSISELRYAAEQGEIDVRDIKSLMDEIDLTEDGASMRELQLNFHQDIKKILPTDKQRNAFHLAKKRLMRNHIKAGKPMEDLYNPSKPEYLGNEKNLKGFRKSKRQLQAAAGETQSGRFDPKRKRIPLTFPRLPNTLEEQKIISKKLEEDTRKAEEKFIQDKEAEKKEREAFDQGIISIDDKAFFEQLRTSKPVRERVFKDRQGRIRDPKKINEDMAALTNTLIGLPEETLKIIAEGGETMGKWINKVVLPEKAKK